jgi:hypothetical protein
MGRKEENQRKKRMNPISSKAEKAGRWHGASLQSEGGRIESFGKKTPRNRYMMDQRIEHRNPRLGAG